MEQRLPRKLAAILYADVAGYSRLTCADEEGTHRRLSEYLDFFSASIEEHLGKVVHYAGDAVLADFGTVSDALSCATAVQRCLAERNKNLPEDCRVQFRVGVNLGEVITDRDDIYGEGVNVAARLESLAEAGGICISGTVYDAVGSRLPLVYESMGEQSVKNIEKPVRAYRVLLDSQQASKATLLKTQKLDLSEKPSVAILPFTNMGGDAEQEYFSDGITEDIITGLGRFRDLVVIARGSSFLLKGESIETAEAAGKLGVQYALKGSVRKSGNRVRVTAQLIEAREGHQIWAESYDRILEDVFEVQDDITQRIISTLAVRLEHSDRRRALRKDNINLSAYDYLLRGKQYFDDFHCSQKHNLRAREMFERAIELEPEYAAAYACLAATYLMEVEEGWTDAPEATGERSIELSRKAIELDDLNSYAHLILAIAYFLVRGNLELTKTQTQRALELNPNDYWNYCFKCWFSTCTGEVEESVFCGREAARRNPFLADSCRRNVGIAEYFAGTYDQAIDTLGKIANPPAEVQACIAAAYAQLGREKEALAAAADFRPRAHEIGLQPNSDEESWRTFWKNRFFKNEAGIEHLLDGLRKAGLSH